MRIAKVIGTVTLSRSLPDMVPGQYLIADVLDSQAIEGVDKGAKRSSPMPESLVVFDRYGAGEGQYIAVSEGGEATQPFRPQRVPVDAYNAAILDSIDVR